MSSRLADRLHADWVFHGGHIPTLDAASPAAQALAVRDERVVARGSDADLQGLCGPQTGVVDLGGRTMLPGFVDAHAHADREGLRRLDPSLADARSVAAIQAAVAREVAHATPGDWIVLGPLGAPPYHQGLPGWLAEGRYPDRHDLDRVAPRNPVYIRAPWGYWSDEPPFVGIANSLALQRVGIDRDTPAPCSTVEIEHDAAGEPTGRLLEWGLVTVLELTLLRAVPRFDAAARLRALRISQELHLAAGTVGIYEGHGVAPEVVEAYRALHAERTLWLRATLVPSPVWPSTDTPRVLAEWGSVLAGAGLGDDWLRLQGLYLSPERNRPIAEALRAGLPYTHWAGFHEPFLGWDEYRELCLLAARHGIRVNTVASPDARPLVDAWETIARQVPLRDLRWVLVHVRYCAPDLLPRIKRLGAVVTTIPATAIYRDGLAARRGGNPVEELLPHRALEDAGIPWAIASDNKPYSLPLAIWAAVARQESHEGQVIGPGQRVTPTEALRAASAGGAYLCWAERRRGTLAPGQLADLIVLDADPLQPAGESLRDPAVALTMVGGRVVHSRGRNLPPADLQPRPS